MILHSLLSYMETKYNLSRTGEHNQDIINEYKVNSFGLRSPELTEPADILITGCSFSYGIGVPENMSWGVQVANKLNLKYHNISIPGKSIIFLINGLFSYFKKIGNPKILICLFPEPFRMEMYSNPSHVIPKNFVGKEVNTIKEDVISYGIILPTTHNNHEKYSKIPYIAEDVFPAETAINISFQYIKFLEMYCKAANIKLVWSTWDEAVEYMLPKIDHEYENYVNVKQNDWHSREEDGWYDKLHKTTHQGDWKHNDPECKEFIDCHSNLRDHYGENWDLASDINGLYKHHWGIHRHFHVAEYFIKELNNEK